MEYDSIPFVKVVESITLLKFFAKSGLLTRGLTIISPVAISETDKVSSLNFWVVFFGCKLEGVVERGATKAEIPLETRAELEGM